MDYFVNYERSRFKTYNQKKKNQMKSSLALIALIGLVKTTELGDVPDRFKEPGFDFDTYVTQGDNCTTEECCDGF